MPILDSSSGSGRRGPGSISIWPEAYQAAIFDLDGVVTKTAKVHAAAWKQLFDEYLRERARRHGDEFRPFDIQSDYRRYVDGKPRYDGVASFLESRGIRLPYGSPADPPDEETVCGLGNRKNRFFLEELRSRGAETFDSTIELIRTLRARKVKTAIVSSSKNCVEVLQSANATDLFDAKVDGRDSERLGLKGKPAPDIFLEAARQLEAEPACSIVVEDAIAGVRAGYEGRFGLVIGVDRAGQAAALRDNGADVVVSDLSEVAIRNPGSAVEARTDELPSALEHLEDIRRLANRRRLAVFLDYDGTLTPIVARPEQAVLSEAARSAVRVLAGRCTVAVVSGRDLENVRSLVGIDSIFYAGSHGFEISDPRGRTNDFEQGTAFLPVLAAAEDELRRALSPVPGAQVERKKFSVAAHYRNAAPDQVTLIRRAVDETLARHPELRMSPGKKVFDLQPAIEWNKGKALLWLLSTLGLESCATLPLYVGDDITDEDAFRAIQGRGIGIVVRDEPRPTAAGYALNSPEEVKLFLEALAGSVPAGVAR